MRLWPLLALWPCAAGADPLTARYVDPTDAYEHGAVANGEYAGLEVTWQGQSYIFHYSGAVFEDTNPRLFDFNGDGTAEVVTVLSGFNDGARIAIFGATSDQIAPIALGVSFGQRNRWYAIAGIADFDGDGVAEIAYIDRPHLAKTLRFLEVAQTDDTWTLTPDGAVEGLTNHHLGSAVIEGGLRDCDQPEVVTANADWSRIMVTAHDGTGYTTRDIGPYNGPDSLTAALDCD